MRLVKQFDDEGCGLACTAMAAGTTYRTVRAKAFPDGEVHPTSLKQLREIMETHGVGLGKKLIPFQTRTRKRVPQDLEFDALLKVNLRQNGREWHWVLWDHERQRILDPKRPVYKRLRYHSFIRLERS